MDQELRQYLDSMKAELKSDGQQIKAELKSDVQQLKIELKSDIERVETALLTEFHKWASPAEMRLKTHTAAIRTMDLEMELLTERVKKLEGKKDN